MLAVLCLAEFRTAGQPYRCCSFHWELVYINVHCPQLWGQASDQPGNILMIDGWERCERSIYK